MRIVLINTLSWDSSITKHTVSFANALSNSAEVLLILKEEQIWQKIEVINKNIKTVFIKFPRMSHLTNINSIFDIVRAINEFKPDVIDIRTGYPWICFGLPFLRKYPLVATFVTAKPRKGEKEKIHYRITSYLLTKSSDQIIVFDQFSKEAMSERFKVSIDNIQVVPIGNYTEVFTQSISKYTADSKKYVLFLGRIVEYKGLEYLIKAEPSINKEIPNTKIIIAGPCDNFQYYESIMNNRDAFIVYNQWIQGEMISELFAKANVVVLPYTEYSKSANIQLAYAFKKPIVSTNLGSISEYVINGETGILVPPGDHEELAKAIIRLLSDDELSNRMGEKGYNLMRNGFCSWDEIIRKVKKVYEGAIEHHSNHHTFL